MQDTSAGAGVYRLVTDRSGPCTFEAGLAAVNKQESFQMHGAEKAERKTIAGQEEGNRRVHFGGIEEGNCL